MNRSFVIALLFVVSMLGGVAFIAVYVSGANTQLEGVTLWLALGALAAALVVWEHEVKPQHETIEERPPLPSAPATQDAAATTFLDGYRAISQRRHWILAMLAGSVGILGLGALLPLRSLTPGLRDHLAHTAWRAGLRLVGVDGKPVHVDDLAVDSYLTVFPEGYVGEGHERDMAVSATMLVRVPPEQLQLPAGRDAWTAQGNIAYSKVCTHAGCPLGLYRATEHELYCPCHQSTFDVLRGGTVVFGPAGHPLPQLPIAVRPDGYLAATGDFPEPIGPAYWERG